jgi:protein TonB
VPRDVYSVKLVGAVATARAAPKAQPAPPKPEPVEEKKVEEKEDQMPAPPTEPKKPRPADKKKSEVPTTDITKTNQKPDTSLVGDSGDAVSGPAGDAPTMGSVSFDGGDFPFASYVNRMRQKIATAWEVPVGTEGLERSSVIYFRVHRDGSVTNVVIETPSGLSLFDRSCQRAVLEAAPLPPLPREYRDEYIGVHFSFLFQPIQ